MTIAIGAFGPRAGQAVFEALRIAELVGRGAIGGFVTYRAIDADGRLHCHETQRGGSRTLFIDGEKTGVPPPDDVAHAHIAGVISSGPERPDPLGQFLAADPTAGLVTGHRLPNGPSVDGNPLNVETLGHLKTGQSAKAAVDAVLDRNPEADVGLIAVDLKGGVYCRNSDRVSKRPDLGHARLADLDTGATVEVLHNAITPFPVLASVAASIAFQVMVGQPEPAGWISIPAGVPLLLGAENAVHCGADGVATQVTTTDPMMVKGRQIGAAIYLHSRVYRGDEVLGLTMFEPIVTVEDGIITEMSGQQSIRMSYLAAADHSSRADAD